ncbi:hypothetical protein EB796_020588 [Bugula neritina]|uniref:SLC18B1 n=1 Tax=Bugula neritina TaxID=10212 RepID=A0A7J7J630_BUGNE|nr:hypothetical protein EB796_020588 [Bugula neritina]
MICFDFIQFGLTQDESSLVFLCIPVCYLISAPIATKLRKQFKEIDNLYFMAGDFLLGVAAFIFMGPSPIFPGLQRPLWLFIVTLALQGVFGEAGLIFTLDLAFTPMNTGSGPTREMNSATQALVSGIWLTSLSIGTFLSPILSGMFIEKMSYGWTTTIYGVMCLVLAVMVLLIQLYRNIRNHYRRADSENKPLLS